MEDDLCLVHEEGCGEAFDDLKAAKEHLQTCTNGHFEWTEWTVALRSEAF